MNHQRSSFDSVPTAIAWLEEHCALLVVQLETEPLLWRVVRLDGEFEALFSEAELVGFARHEWDVRRMPFAPSTRAEPVEGEKLTERLAGWSINTGADAFEFLRSVGMEPISTTGGWIIHEKDNPDDGLELTCDSNADLIDYARAERDICLRLRSEPGVDSFSTAAFFNSYSFRGGGGAPEAQNSDALSAAGSDEAKEVRK